MRMVKVVLILAALAVAAAPAFAACPNTAGSYSTTDGTLLAGRASEAWCAGGPGQPGDMENTMSWDGATLGGQWKMWGMTIDANGAILVNTRTFGPYTYLDYATDYEGGQFWLSGAHTWAAGVDLVGHLTAYHVATTVTLYNGVPVGQTSNVTMTGVFDECTWHGNPSNCVLEFAIANAMKIWDSNAGTPMPANYPSLLCGATIGELFDACCIMASINCAVATESETWGSLKASYR